MPSALAPALKIVNKFLPSQDRRDVITLNDLVVTLAKLTQSKSRKKFKDIAIIRKAMKRLRQEVKYSKEA